jgi:hypothetical protein
MLRAIGLALGLVFAGSASAALQSVEISFSKEEALTDLQIGSNRGEDVRQAFADAVTRFFLSSGVQAEQGSALTLEFHDVDMAGEVQYWRNPEGRPIRYVELAYPARLSFSYQLRNAEGQALESGDVQVQEVPFSLNTMRYRNRPFAYEVKALRDWWRKRD